MGTRVSSAVFVGRARELAVLEQALERARGGESRTVLLAGEAGVGKSRLVQQFATRVRAGGGQVLVGGCLQMSGLPYAAVVEALRGLVADVGLDAVRQHAGAHARDLRPLVPELGRRMAGGVENGPDDEAGQARTFEALLHLLGRLARERPLVLVLEDVHWADPSTRDLLVFLAHNLRRQAVAVVATSRSDELHRLHPLRPVLSELGRSPRVDRVELAPFTREELVAQLESILAAPPRRELVDEVLDRSQGNPFFAEELLAADAPDPTALPASLLDILLTTLERLPTLTQQALRVAAAAGRRVHHELLARVVQVSPHDLADALRQAVDRQLLVPDTRDGTYAFRHALFAEAVATTTLPGEREALHARLAEVLEAEPQLAATAPAAELAHHWQVANDRIRSLTASVEAAREAQQLHAVVEARTHVERLLDLWDHVDDAPAHTGLDHTEVLAWLADLAHLSGAPHRAVALLERAIAAHDPAADPVRHGLMHERLGRCRQSTGDEAGFLTAVEHALRLVPADPPSSGRARVLTAHAHALWESDPEQALASADGAAAIARTVGDRHVEAGALTLVGSALAALGRLDEGLARLDEARTIAEDDALPEVVARAHVLLSAVLIRGGRLEEGAEVSLAGLERVRELGVAGGYASNLAGNATSGLFLSGRWDEATDLITEVTGDSVGVGWLHLLHARLLAHLGDAEGAAAALAAARRFAGDRDPRFPNVALWLAVLAGDLDEAHRLVLARHERVVTAHAGTINEQRALGLRVEAERLAAGATDTAGIRALADQLLAETTDRLGAGIAYAVAWQQTAVAEHSRLGTSDPDAWHTAVDAWDEAGQPHQAAYARFRLAESLLGTDTDTSRRIDDAAHHLREALATADRLGAAPLRADVVALARRAGVELPTRSTSRAAAPGDRPYGLTPREQEVLALVARGRTNREVGDALFIAEKTASVHVSNILRKLDVGARTEAAAVAFRDGLVDF